MAIRLLVIACTEEDAKAMPCMKLDNQERELRGIQNAMAETGAKEGMKSIPEMFLISGLHSPGPPNKLKECKYHRENR
jgi:hypothetical protein